ncbi:DUF3515 domain-containing protein [Streptomyces sp. NPDC090442]|uniref:DUF3515 domain-containing protein n=1 Tax=Streptomyces sp. NPDC090442 TaxID=3365962 RepID=UPI0037F87DA1
MTLSLVIVAGVIFLRWNQQDVEIPESAPNASSPLCVKIEKKYPIEMLGEERRRVEAQGVAVWGDSKVVLRCGMEPPRPTVDPCMNVNGVDWVLVEQKSNQSQKTLITYGRAPAVEVIISDGSPSAGDGLVDLSASIKGIPQKSKCL